MSIPLIALTLSAILQASAIATPPAAPTDKTAAKPLRLAFITCAVDQKFFDPVKRGMNDAATALNVECDFLGTPGVDVPAQIELVKKAVADGYEGIAINIIDAKAFDDVIADTIAKGVPVVGFNVDDSASPNARLAAVSQQFEAAGRKLATLALPDVPQGAHVLLTKHDEGVSALVERSRGIQEVLKSKGITWTAVVTGNDAVAGARVVAKALRKHPEIRIILGSGQSDTEAAGRAIEASFPQQGYWAAGFDMSPKTLQLIEAGAIRFTLDQQPYAQGFYPVVQLTLNLRYGLAPASLDAGAGVIDKKNVARVKQLCEEGFR
ncbi:substrate-binding domain-containing protein [Lacipirellula parvula]|uniref:substrate-binding domain-containing protein n=1 Tax=Lacipirellula parvula TaxID=2650471 RepID=UPI001561F9BD|nr:substrate-binding domain-containing protein [Lacipirellula parvula]